MPYVGANCCNPIPGDSVFGFTTINEGIKLHKKDCPNAVNLQANYGYRILKAKWIDSSNREFKVKITISGIDNENIVSAISLAVTGTKDIIFHDINIKSEDSYFEGFIRVSVKNNEQVIALIKNLEAVNGIVKVKREKK